MKLTVDQLNVHSELAQQLKRAFPSSGSLSANAQCINANATATSIQDMNSYHQAQVQGCNSQMQGYNQSGGLFSQSPTPRLDGLYNRDFSLSNIPASNPPLSLPNKEITTALLSLQAVVTSLCENFASLSKRIEKLEASLEVVKPSIGPKTQTYHVIGGAQLCDILHETKLAETQAEATRMVFRGQVWLDGVCQADDQRMIRASCMIQTDEGGAVRVVGPEGR